MSRRRQRGAAYRARRAQRQARMVCVSDVVTVTIGPLTAVAWPLSMRMLGVLPEPLTAEQQADLETWARHMETIHGPQLTELSTPDEVAAFFADNVTHDTYSSRGNVR